MTGLPSCYFLVNGMESVVSSSYRTILSATWIGRVTRYRPPRSTPRRLCGVCLHASRTILVLTEIPLRHLQHLSEICRRCRQQCFRYALPDQIVELQYADFQGGKRPRSIGAGG